MIRKILLVIFFTLFLICQQSKTALAAGEFSTESNVTFKILASGKTEVEDKITLVNEASDYYVSSYNLLLSNINVEGVRVLENGKTIKSSLSQAGEKTTIKIDFDDAVVGKGESRTFSVYFQNSEFAQKNGEVWEISLPRLASEDSFKKYEVKMVVPLSFGKAAYLSPSSDAYYKDESWQTFTFGKKSQLKTGISVGFGEFQVFSFNLNYHLDNPNKVRSYVDIAIPPDTSMQKVSYQILDPKPDNVSADTDGNWLARYFLNSGERMDVKASGYVQIFSSPRHLQYLENNDLKKYLKGTDFWQAADPAIVALAQKLKTPKAIYDYVSTTLSYSYDKVSAVSERLGAIRAIANPKEAICMEFSDLFIAIARAAEIPAREINGYAYTENPKVQPLSLVADVLHSWPEYWDAGKSLWVPIDPTWASTTGGVDYFNKLDLRHFAFVIHGIDSTKPYPPGSYKLGSNPQKDVFVSFSQMPKTTEAKPEVVVEKSDYHMFLPNTIRIKIYNRGNIALYNVVTSIYFDKKENATKTIEVIPPYGYYELTETIPFKLMAGNIPNSITVKVGDQSYESLTFKNQAIIYNLLFITIILAAIIIFAIYKIRKVSLLMLISKITNYGKRFRKPSADKNH